MTNNTSRAWDWAILLSSMGFLLWHARYQILYVMGATYQLLVFIFG